MKKIVFNNHYFFNSSTKDIKNILFGKLRKTAAGNRFFKKCNSFLEKKFKAKKCIITNSCTSALEIAALLIDAKDGDEIIMPSYTFVSTANAFVLRGAKPVFVDVRKDNLNIDEKLIEKAITKKTKAIVAVHYAGIPCEMNEIKKIAKKYNLIIIEDAAQAIFSRYKNKYCGTLGDIGCFSFHETKNISSCEGGALILNNKKYFKKASVICNKGTNREEFFNNNKKFYSWVGIGSSYIPSEITCSILYNQLTNYKEINKTRKKLWYNYYNNLNNINPDLVRKTYIPNRNIEQNHHIYYLICRSKKLRDLIIMKLKSKGILAVFHYIPLHKSQAGKSFCKTSKKLKNTENLSKRILRLPLWAGMNQNYIIKALQNILLKEKLKN